MESSFAWIQFVSKCENLFDKAISVFPSIRGGLIGNDLISLWLCDRISNYRKEIIKKTWFRTNEEFVAKYSSFDTNIINSLLLYYLNALFFFRDAKDWNLIGQYSKSIRGLVPSLIEYIYANRSGRTTAVEFDSRQFPHFSSGMRVDRAPKMYRAHQTEQTGRVFTRTSYALVENLIFFFFFSFFSSNDNTAASDNFNALAK